MPSLIKIFPDGTEKFVEGGSRIEAIEWNDDGSYKGIAGYIPIVGCSLLVGSITARSYSDSDFWLTTPVTEIVEDNRYEDGSINFIRFKTKNSEYELR